MIRSHFRPIISGHKNSHRVQLNFSSPLTQIRTPLSSSTGAMDLISAFGPPVQVQQMQHTTWFGPERQHLAPLFEAILAGLVLEQPSRPRRYIYRCLLQIHALKAQGLRNSEIRFAHAVKFYVKLNWQFQTRFMWWFWTVNGCATSKDGMSTWRHGNIESNS